jgi:hypothetical protein
MNKIISMAVRGDILALQRVLNFYARYIGKLAGNDSDLRLRLESKLITAILKFKINLSPQCGA